MLSITEISKRLGISKATVSRAFDMRHSGEVRPQTRQRILDYCETLGYHPTITGRSFSTGKTFKVGVLMESHAQGPHSPLFSICLHAFGGVIQKHGFAVTMLYVNAPDSSRQIINFLKSSIADGYVILSQLIDDAVLDAVMRCSRPVVMMDYICSGISGISVVSRELYPAYRRAWDATTALERRHSIFVHFGGSGHKRDILRKSAPSDVSMKELILHCNSDNFLTNYRNSRQAIRVYFEHLSAARLIWCCSDLVALAIYDELCERGIIPGRDIKLIGFDNIEETTSGFEHPVLSTVDPKWSTCGIVLAETLLKEIEEHNCQPQKIAVESEFVFRESFRKRCAAKSAIRRTP